MPAIMSRACDSQMPVSHVRSGNFGMTLSMPVPPGIAAVHATIFSSFCMSSTSASPIAEVKERPSLFISTRQASGS